MALIDTALSVGLATFRPKRKIGTFTTQITFEEQHQDDVTITQHPVEQGAPITDHAYNNPARLTLHVGWAPSALGSVVSAAKSLLQGNLQSALGSVLGTDQVQETYKKLLELKEKREPFEVTTGKRKYKNMLISSLVVTTDQKTENVLMVVVSLQQIIIVETQATTLPPSDQQADPQKTTPPAPQGTKQLAPASNANTDALKVVQDLKNLQRQAAGG